VALTFGQTIKKRGFLKRFTIHKALYFRGDFLLKAVTVVVFVITGMEFYFPIKKIDLSLLILSKDFL
jgi:hypothetical protein